MRTLVVICACLFLSSCDNSKNNGSGQSGGTNSVTADDEANSCSSHWDKCKDNADLINNWSDITDAQVSCETEAEKQAQYGTPKWPWLPFSTFYPGNDYVPAGKIILIEQEAQFQNGFSAMVHSEVWCLYDLRTKTVANVAVAAKGSMEAVEAELEARQWIPQKRTPDEKAASNSGQATSDQRGSSKEPQPGVQATPAPESEGPNTEAPASQGDDVMQPRFGNTVLSRSQTTEWHLWFRTDGTFTGREARSNYDAAGSWTRSGENLCLNFVPPLNGVSNPSCQPVAAHQIGDTWVSNGATVTLVQGIQ